MHVPTPAMLMKSCLLALFGYGIATTASIAQSATHAPSSKPVEVHAVLELFTSQGCSSCPPADALLHKYAQRKDLIALSYPVDYWDYLGWKDTLAKPKFSARQKYYAKTRGDGRVYTPQLVVNGRTHVIGSAEGAINTAIETTSRDLASKRVPVAIRAQGKHLVVEIGTPPPGTSVSEGTIWLAMVHHQYDVKIERGENRGKTVHYANVVRELNPIGVWTGKPDTLEVSRDAIFEPGNDMCVVLVQVGKAGPIIGAASFTNP